MLKDYKQAPFNIENLESWMYRDLKSNNGFIIEDQKGLDKTLNERTILGIYSPMYGSMWGDDKAFEELYSCDCGYLQGKVENERVCPKCGTICRYKDKNVKMTGWFFLDNYKVIHPTLLDIIGKIIPPARLEAMFKIEWAVDEESNKFIKPVINEDSKNIKKYDGIGMIEFRKRFDEIIEFFAAKTKTPTELAFIKENRDKVFTSSLPVMHLFLRPINITDEDMNIFPINNKYSSLSSKVFILNEQYGELDNENEKIVNTHLYSIQKTYKAVLYNIYKLANRKGGIIRNNILGSRYNSTLRCVIVPAEGGKIDEIDYPYLGFLEVYKPEIINLLCKCLQINASEAYRIWFRAGLKFDERVFNIMCYIVDEYEPYIELNRNPTLKYGGISVMKIRKVKPSIRDLTLAIPINIAGAFNADFDGKTLPSLNLLNCGESCYN